MKTLNVNVLTPTPDQVEEAIELFKSIAEAVSAWSEKDSNLIVEALIDLDRKAIKAPLDWDALIPDNEIYDTFTSGMGFKFDSEEEVAIMTTFIRPQWLDLIASVMPQSYLEYGVAIVDNEQSSITMRFSNASTQAFQDVKEGIEYNPIYVA